MCDLFFHKFSGIMFVVLVMFIAIALSAPDKCSITTIGLKTENKVPLNVRKYAAHTEEFIVEVTSDVCGSRKYSGTEVAACDADYFPFVTPLDAHRARVHAGTFSDLSSQIYVYINAFC